MLEYIGDGRAPYVSRVSIEEARRRENVNPDNEDNILMGNGSALRETAWKGQYHDLHFLNLLNFLYGYCDTFREETFIKNVLIMFKVKMVLILFVSFYLILLCIKSKKCGNSLFLPYYLFT